MVKKVCFVSGTRADYGIMAPIMCLLSQNPEIEVQVVATNMHLSPKFGMTINEIEADGFRVNEKIESIVEDDSPSSTVLSMANVERGMALSLSRLMPDLIVILGDRYEALAAASAAVVFNIPIVHLHGGETTLGAFDDKFRHAITQLATYHFAATPAYVDKIVSMGIDPKRVFHSGAPGAEGIEFKDDTRQKFIEKTGILPEQPFIILALHPVTLLPDKGLTEIRLTLEALEEIISQGYHILVSMPNSDPGHDKITNALNEFIESHPDTVKGVRSMGKELFHYAMDNAAAIVGNSSAALIEAPSHRLPAVNIGIRQKGRAHGVTVIDSPADKNRILMALQAALSMEMKSVLLGLSVSSLNPYYKEEAAKFIAEKILYFLKESTINSAT